MLRRWGSAVLLLAGGGACGDGGGPAAPDPCATAPRVEVSSGTRPTFTWTPACGFDHLDVVDVTPAGDGHVVWVTGGPPGGPGLLPPVQFPEVDPGVEYGVELPLVSGRQYRVSILAYERAGGICLFECSSETLWHVTATFTP